MRQVFLVLSVAVVAALPATAQAQVDGAAVYARACAACHGGASADPRAPSLETMRQLAPEVILSSLMVGRMFRQGAELSDAERQAVSAYVAGRAVGTAPPPIATGRCTAPMPPLSAAAIAGGWNGWGGDVTNWRYRPAERAGLTAATLPKVTLKWAFGFPGVTSARSQPAVMGGVVFVASDAGAVFALDARTGCTYWQYQAQAGVRTAISVGPYRTAAGGAGYAVYFADGRAVAYAVDAATGRSLWTRQVDEHPYAQATGSPTLHEGRLYVTLSAVGEEGQGGRPGYPCCTFRGSVTALDANTGAVVWKTYSITEEPRPRGRSTEGVELWGPAGAAIWAAPTIDVGRGALYVATGNGYAGPDQPGNNAIIALDLRTGAIRWVSQRGPNDLWAGGCRPQNPDNPNCPERQGPDHDFSMSPILATRSDGRDILIVQQKSGMAYGLDPDDGGAVVWEYRTSAGSGLGGMWGAAVDGQQAYFGVRTPGGLRAARIDTGQEVWSIGPPERLCGTAPGCSASQGAALTAIPGALLSVSMDGGLRAHASATGEILWQFDTNGPFETVNGVPAHGGAIDGPGVVVHEGMLFVGSGYVSLIGRPGNVLLAFGID